MKKQATFIILLLCNIALAQFTQKPLPYSYSALEPYIDAQTMEIHFSKHHATYVKNLNAALVGTPEEKATLEELFSKISKLSITIRNNAGGHYNHELFWSVLSPDTATKPSAELKKAIEEKFVTIEALKIELNKVATTRFGSGWAWLYVGLDGKLAICSTANQDNPLMDIVDNKGLPILGIDVWEHAYYLKYQNKRADYLGAIWNIINWNEVSRRYAEAIKKK